MIKSILVPTDFSACAGYALDAAVKLAQRFESHLHLLHVKKLPADWATLPAPQRAALPEVKEATAQLEALMANHPGRSWQGAVLPQSLAARVGEYVTENGVDLVVMGSFGASGKSEFFIGSNTQKVVRTVHCPVLVLKKPLEKLVFDRVLFASSFNENERAPFLRFKDFVKHFIPEIHLAIVHTSSLFDPPYIVSQEAMEGYKALCEPFECKTHILRDFSVEQAVRSFAGKIGAQLIAISNHHRHPIKRMLIGSNVEALVNHAEVPVLSIDYPTETEKES